MSNSSEPSFLLLADTNIAYCLYFFLGKDLFSNTNILLPDGSKLKFHPIVLEEVEGHQAAMKLFSEYGISSEYQPSFFSDIGENEVQKIVDFVKNNIAEIQEVDVDSRHFVNKRRVYEGERKRLQSEWKKTGVKGKKVNSKPSDADYSILFSAHCSKCKIVTNDEILLSVAEEFLESGYTFKVEDIINSYFVSNQSLKKDIEEVVGTLNQFGFTFNLSRALRNPGQ